jgi:hypothetical protein
MDKLNEQLHYKLCRVRELVDLLENCGHQGWHLRLDFKKSVQEESSGWEDSERHPYDVLKYHTESTI